MTRFVFTALVLVGLGACVSPPTSPWEIQVQLERSVSLLGGKATIAVRAENLEEPEIVLNVQCEGTNRTLAVPKNTVTPEVCGLHFELTDLPVRDGAAQSATLSVTWDSEGSDE